MRTTLAVLVLSVMAVAGRAWPASAQSLGDLAKQEEERRKALKEQSKVITNKDVPRVAAPEVPATTAGAPSAPAADAVADTAPATDGAKDAEPSEAKDQKYWTERKRALTSQLEHDEMFAAALQSQINGLWTDFVNRDDPAQQALIANNRQKALDELARVKQSIENDKKALADLEDEARRANVPPGWLR